MTGVQTCALPIFPRNIFKEKTVKNPAEHKVLVRSVRQRGDAGGQTPPNSLPPGLPGTWVRGFPGPLCTCTHKPPSSLSRAWPEERGELLQAGVPVPVRPVPDGAPMASVCAAWGEPCHPPLSPSTADKPPGSACPPPNLACAPGGLLNARPRPSLHLPVSR